MNKQKLVTAAYAVDPERLDSASEEYHKHIRNRLGLQLAEQIFSELGSGEKIIRVGKPYEHYVEELDQTEIREIASVEELVRCKNCKWWDEQCHFGNWRYGQCTFEDTAINSNCLVYQNYFCADAEREG